MTLKLPPRLSDEDIDAILDECFIFDLDEWKDGDTHFRQHYAARPDGTWASYSRPMFEIIEDSGWAVPEDEEGYAEDTYVYNGGWNWTPKELSDTEVDSILERRI